MNLSTVSGVARAALLSLLSAALALGCTTDRVPPGQCEFDSQCPSGQVCADRYCRATCRADSDCPSGGRCLPGDRAGTMVCILPSPEAPLCRRDSDCPAGQACLDNQCRPQCQSDYDCQIVNPLTTCVMNHCVPVMRCPEARGDCDRVASNGCEVDLRVEVPHCGACGRACPAVANGTPACRSGRCEPVCNATHGDCDANAANGCETPLMTDRAHCGACGRACPEGQVCSGGACGSSCAAPGEVRCGDRCVDAQTDVMNCGACGNACPAPAGGAATCAAGRCGVMCRAGFADCDMNPANGCETDLSTADNCGACGRRCAAPTPTCAASDGSFACSAAPCSGTVCSGACVDTQTDVRNCGACGTACESGPGSEARCEGGRCALRCTEATRADCDGTARTGCEADLPRDPTNCGACGTRCAGGPNATPACADRMCGLACNAGFGNCDGVAANGCEVALAADVTHCGRCGDACSAPANARATCAAGACGFACNANFADCDMSPANGCEVSTRDDRANCGACGRACPTGQVCSAGACTTVCGAGETNCSGSCANLASSLSHCGMCGRACPSPPNATPSCAEGRCGFTCAAGFGDCDGNPANGCETSLQTSATSCGRCGNACSLANATAACSAGACVIARCNAGFADCDMSAANGCEVDTRASAGNCGACGRACSLANATSACASGVCAVVRCNAGFADCDMNPANGCETDTRSSVAHCGACGMACSAAGGTASCAMSTCAIACAAGRGNCNVSVADGCEVDTSTAVAHCGRCGNACMLPNATAGCDAGACTVARCNAGFGNCDMNPANGCEVNTNSTVAHCGACGRACSLPNATAGCAAGACVTAACNAGFADCDMNPANGCEVNLAADPANCARCGNACSAAGGAPACSAGVCTIACAAGRGNCNMSVADGCEVDTNTSVTHCGGCGRTCSLPNATAGCAAGACTVASCNAGFANCDATASNGCEVNLNTDPANCMRCGNRCPTGQVCTGGACMPVCGAGEVNCGGRCVNTATDTSNCGRCGNACPAPSNASATCASGACGFACNAGFGNCDGNATNGCETNVTTAVAHCGRCGNACSFPNATAACASGACAIAACNAGFGNCDGNAANGCETNTNATPAHCGACGRACSLPNATAGCAAGACTVASCNAGFADCDGNPANGCEVNLNTDPANCGACRTTCSFSNATAACTGGRCAIAACNAGFGNCDGVATNGCETDTNTTVAHCGGCGMACSATNGAPSCSGGNCSIACNRAGSFDGPTFYFREFWGNCDGNARANGCETDLLTPSNCQMCGRACSFPNAMPACARNTATQCYIGACNAGFADCNATPADGCETNTAGDSSNCGACGTTCDPATRSTGYPHTCRASSCRPTNDACSAATPINLAAGRQVWLRGLTTNAVADMAAPCRGAASPDVFFSFTLTQRELVYADTHGDGSTARPVPSYDTVLFLASSCASALTATPPAGEVYCNDDASSIGCSTTQSVVTAVLDPGTYYLVLSGYAGQSGTAWINFQHLPVGNGAPAFVGPMGAGYNYTFRGATAGAGTLAPAASCNASGPEVTYWWRQCTTAARYAVTASTCNAGSGYDTVLYYRNALSSADQCNDDAGATSCPMRATLSITGGSVPYGAGIHAVTVDGYGGQAGSYVLTLSGQVIITSLDPERGICRPPHPRAVPPPRRRRAEGPAAPPRAG